MSTKLTNILLSVLVLMLIGIGIWAYPQLPEQVAGHWDFSGNVNGYMSRFWGVALVPLLLIALWALFAALPVIDPLKENVAKFRSQYNLLILATGIFVFGIGKITVLWNLGYDLPITRIMAVGVALLTVVIGTVLPQTKRNYFMGIRTPWTLASDEVWNATHQQAGQWFVAAGCIGAIAGLVPDERGIFLSVGSLLFASIASVVSSYLIFRTQQERK